MDENFYDYDQFYPFKLLKIVISTILYIHCSLLPLNFSSHQESPFSKIDEPPIPYISYLFEYIDLIIFPLIRHHFIKCFTVILSYDLFEKESYKFSFTFQSENLFPFIITCPLNQSINFSKRETFYQSWKKLIIILLNIKKKFVFHVRFSFQSSCQIDEEGIISQLTQKNPGIEIEIKHEKSMTQIEYIIHIQNVSNDHIDIDDSLWKIGFISFFENGSHSISSLQESVPTMSSFQAKQFFLTLEKIGLAQKVGERWVIDKNDPISIYYYNHFHSQTIVFE